MLRRQPTDTGLTETWSPGIDAELRKEPDLTVGSFIKGQAYIGLRTPSPLNPVRV